MNKCSDYLKALVENNPLASRLGTRGFGFLFSSHPETQIFPFPFDGGGKGGGDNDLESQTFFLGPPHPAPLPRGEREFPDGNYLARDPLSFFRK